MQGRYKNKINRFTLYSAFNYALHYYYTDDLNSGPTPARRNSYIYLTSNEPGVATVDWGDGIVENFDFVAGSTFPYICSFRALSDETYKGQGNENWWWLDKNGISITPYPNHQYADNDKTKARKITITCSNEITAFVSVLNKMSSFPLLESESLRALQIEYSTNIKEIPIDRISGLSTLTSLVLISTGSIMQVIPKSLFELTKLKSLTLSNIFNLSNADSSNLRLIKNLTELQTLDLSLCDITTYVKEFNSLPKLKTLDVSARVNNAPGYEEVTEINQSLTSFTTLSSLGSRTEFDNMTGKKIDKITAVNCWDSRALDVKKLPSYWLEMRAITSINFGQALRTQQRADDFVNYFYSLVIGWSQLTMSQTAKDSQRNQFYKLNLIIYSAIYQADQRPSGIYQPPSGFVEGSVNGNPTTPMEKIYILTKNYAQTWMVRPETTTRKMRSTNSIPDGYYLDNSVLYNEKEPIYNNEIKPLENEYTN